MSVPPSPTRWYSGPPAQANTPASRAAPSESDSRQPPRSSDLSASSLLANNQVEALTSSLPVHTFYASPALIQSAAQGVLTATSSSTAVAAQPPQSNPSYSPAAAPFHPPLFSRSQPDDFRGADSKATLSISDNAGSASSLRKEQCSSFLTGIGYLEQSDLKLCCARLQGEAEKRMKTDPNNPYNFQYNRFCLTLKYFRQGLINWSTFKFRIAQQMCPFVIPNRATPQIQYYPEDFDEMIQNSKQTPKVAWENLDTLARLIVDSKGNTSSMALDTAQKLLEEMGGNLPIPPFEKMDLEQLCRFLKSDILLAPNAHLLKEQFMAALLQKIPADGSDREEFLKLILAHFVKKNSNSEFVWDSNLCILLKSKAWDKIDGALEKLVDLGMKTFPFSHLLSDAGHKFLELFIGDE
jgi:hypothetical protein